MKKLMFIAIVSSVFFACNRQNNDAPVTVVEEDQVVATPPTNFDKEFDAALDAFKNDDYLTASIYLDDAVEEMKEDQVGLSAEEQSNFNEAISIIQSISKKVQNGEVESPGELTDIFGYVDALIAREYIVFTSTYAEKYPKKAKSSYDKATKRSDRASQKMTGHIKQSWDEMMSDIRQDLAKADEKSNAIGNAAGEKVVKLDKWLHHRAEELNLPTPSHANF